MDRFARIEARIRQIKNLKALSFIQEVKDTYHDQPGVYNSFLNILYEYTKYRTAPIDMYLKVSRLFGDPDLVEKFCNCLPQSTFFRDEDVAYFTELFGKAKIEDYGTKPVTEFGPTSTASTSYASNYPQSLCPSGCCPLEGNTVASGSSSSSQSWPGNVAEPSDAQTDEAVELTDIILYVTETKTNLVNGHQAYQHLIELVKQMNRKRTDTYDVMERASFFLQGYPELIESFNRFLPDRYRIVVLSDDHEMNTE